MERWVLVILFLCLVRRIFSQGTPSVSSFLSPELAYSFDYIIVGAGPSGCILANRLVQNSSISVLLLERGQPIQTYASAYQNKDIPRFENDRWSVPYMTETIYTQPSSNMLNRTINLLQGNSPGGSVSISSMSLVQPPHSDFDNWDIPGWEANILQNYFIQLRTDIPQEVGIQNTYVPKWLDAAQQADFDVINNVGQEPGWGIPLRSIKNGKLQNPYTLFIDPILDTQENLEVRWNSLVTELLFDETNTWVTGIKYIDIQGKKIEVEARKEVILTAGPLHTPRLLMLAGIGSASELANFNISSRVDLPALGKMVIPPAINLLNLGSITAPEMSPDVVFGDAARKEWESTGTGPLATSSNGAFGYWNFNQSSDMSDVAMSWSGVLPIFQVPTSSSTAAQCILTHPKSISQVGLNSASVFDPPVIYPNFFQDQSDVNLLRDCFKTLRKIYSESNFGTLLGREFVRSFAAQTDSEIVDYILHETTAATHYFGSAVMGNSSLSSVVDPSLLVHGIHNLRIADSSIIPSLSVHPAFTAYVIGAKAADLLKASDITRPNSIYDYIVVGGGTSGSVIASRLSEDPSIRVLLLEEGEWLSDAVRDFDAKPRNIFDLWGIPTLCHRFELEASRGLLGQRQEAFIGRGLGGTTNINGGLWSRPAQSDFNRWGVPGWTSGEDTLQYYRKVEDFEGGTPPNHGVGGPVHIEVGQTQKFAQTFLDACAQVGIPVVDDISDGTDEHHNGMALLHRNVRNGRRQDAFTAYLKPHLNRTNLVIQASAKVLKVTFDKQGNWATGVFYQDLHQNKKKYASAAREVILSAGAYNSPKILLLSGVGKTDDLGQMGIYTYKDIPSVGQNLIARPLVNLLTLGTQMAPEMNLTVLESQAALDEWLANGTGVWNIGPTGVLGYVKIDKSLPYPDMMIQYTDISPMDKTPSLSAHLISCVLATPKSRGQVRLQSPNPFDEVYGIPMFLEDSSDTETLFGCLKLARAITAAPIFNPLRGYGFAPDDSILDDSDLRKYVQAASINAYHVYGSLAIGPFTDASGTRSVVNPDLHVHGIKNLRVADASIIPFLTSGPQATSFMIGEKCAAMVQSQSVSNRGLFMVNSLIDTTTLNPSTLLTTDFAKTATAIGLILIMGCVVLFYFERTGILWVFRNSASQDMSHERRESLSKDGRHRRNISWAFRLGKKKKVPLKKIGTLAKVGKSLRKIPQALNHKQAQTDRKIRANIAKNTLSSPSPGGELGVLEKGASKSEISVAGHRKSLMMIAQGDNKQGSSLSFAKLQYKVKHTDSNGTHFKTILHDVAGHMVAGDLVGIIGPSGAGKSSLIKILAQRPLGTRARCSKDTFKLQGFLTHYDTVIVGTESKEVRVRHSERWVQQNVRLVPQEPALLSGLTVRQTLLYSAWMQMPEDARTKTERVELTLEEVGLAQHAETPVEVLSGGQKARLNIGIHLLTLPSILICDEPTSGLDSYTALQIISLLRGLTNSGRTIILSIHQPRPEIFTMLDKVLVVASGGTQVFFGKRALLTKIALRSMPRGSSANPADHVLDIITTQKNHKLLNLLKRSLKSQHLDEHAREIAEKSPEAEDDHLAMTTPSSFMVLLVMLARFIKRQPIGKMYSFPIASLAISLLLGSMFWQLGNQTMQDMYYRVWCMYFGLNAILYTAFFQTANLFMEEEKRTFEQEKADGMVNNFLFCIFLFLRDTYIVTVGCIVYWLPIYFMVGLRPEYGHVLLSLLVVTLSVNAVLSVSISIFLICSLNTTVMLQGVWTAFNVIFAGVIKHKGDFPLIWKWLPWPLPEYWGLAASANIELRGLEMNCAPGDLPVICSNGDQALINLDLASVDIYESILILTGMILAGRVLGYIFLLLRVTIYPEVDSGSSEKINLRVMGARNSASVNNSPASRDSRSLAPNEKALWLLGLDSLNSRNGREAKQKDGDSAFDDNSDDESEAEHRHLLDSKESGLSGSGRGLNGSGRGLNGSGRYNKGSRSTNEIELSVTRSNKRDSLRAPSIDSISIKPQRRPLSKLDENRSPEISVEREDSCHDFQYGLSESGVFKVTLSGLSRANSSNELIGEAGGSGGALTAVSENSDEPDDESGGRFRDPPISTPKKQRHSASSPRKSPRKSHSITSSQQQQEEEEKKKITSPTVQPEVINEEIGVDDDDGTPPMISRKSISVDKDVAWMKSASNLRSPSGTPEMDSQEPTTSPDPLVLFPRSPDSSIRGASRAPSPQVASRDVSMVEEEPDNDRGSPL